MKTYSTYLPVFPGFYNTWFDESEFWMECELSDEEQFRRVYDELAEVPWEFIRSNFFDCVDWRSGYEAMAEAIAGKLPKLLPRFVKEVTKAKLKSPKEYNFYNDSIDCDITVFDDELRSYLSDNAATLEHWLQERYSHRSGFVSFHPNSLQGWRDVTEDFTALDGHYCGALLDFVAVNEKTDPEEELYALSNLHEVFSNNVKVNTAPLLEAWNKTKAKKNGRRKRSR